MASQGAASNSRLAQMQVRFQQRQLQEREQKRLELTDEAKAVGNGKVRQMFDERRRGAGIDRSIPLKPISTVKKATHTITSTTTRVNCGPNVLTKKPNQPPLAATRQVTNRRTMTRANTIDQNASNGNILINKDSVDNAKNEALSKAFTSLSLTETHVNGNGIGDGLGDSNNNEYSKTRVMSSNSIKLNPVITKKSPNVQTSVRQSTPLNSANATRATTRSTPTRLSASPKVTTPKKKSPVLTTTLGVTPAPRAVTPPPGMASCNFCGRNFLEERLAKHEQVCQKMANTKRKIFDASKFRVKGTEAEKYLKKSSRGGGNTAPSSKAVAGKPSKKSNWRKAHEEFITAIRAAKQVQSHLAKGGKLSDLPPPPPSENAHYVQCPHCSRRFNQAAAERHIPKCANMLHNKPKPGVKQGLQSKRR